MADNSDKRVHNQSHHPFKEWGSQTRPGRRKTRRHRNRFFFRLIRRQFFGALGKAKTSQLWVTILKSFHGWDSYHNALQWGLKVLQLAKYSATLWKASNRRSKQLLSNGRDPHASGKGIFLTLVISLPDCSVLPPDCPYSLLLVRTVTLDGRQPPQATLEHSLPCLGSPYSTPLCPLEPPSSPSSSILEESVPPWAHPRGRVQNPSTE